MKEVVLNWRGRDITVKYRCINFAGFHYAIVIDKNGNKRHLHKRLEEGRWLWHGGNDWPRDLIELLSDFFNQQVPEWRKPDR